MPACKDMVGQRYGRLIVTCKSQKTDSRKNSHWNCICDCGNMVTVRGDHLKSGNTKSCGCYSSDHLTEWVKTHEGFNVKHGGGGTRLYGIWKNMLRRCENLNSKQYRHYGARGISVCEPWHKFENFRDWALSSGYNDMLTIDRADNDQGYGPDNCRWVTQKVQCNNKRNNVIANIDGARYTISELSDRTGICYGTLHDRFRRGYRGHQLLEHAQERTPDV